MTSRWWTRRTSEATSINIPIRSSWPEGTRTMADDLAAYPPDPTPHIHFHEHGGSRHVHEHVHPDNHAHSAQTDLPAHRKGHDA